MTHPTRQKALLMAAPGTNTCRGLTHSTAVKEVCLCSPHGQDHHPAMRSVGRHAGLPDASSPRLHVAQALRPDGR